MHSDSLLLFLNVLLYLIVHKMKFRRSVGENLQKIVDGIFGALMMMVIVMLCVHLVWYSRTLLYLDLAAVVVCLAVVVFQINFKLNSLSKLFHTVFTTKKSIAESLALTILLLADYFISSLGIASLLIYMFLLVKEAYLISNLTKK